MGSLEELKDLLIELESFVEFSCGSMHCETDEGDRKLLNKVEDVTENWDKYKKEWVDKEVERRLKEFENSAKEDELLKIFENKKKLNND